MARLTIMAGVPGLYQGRLDLVTTNDVPMLRNCYQMFSTKKGIFRVPKKVALIFCCKRRNPKNAAHVGRLGCYGIAYQVKSIFDFYSIFRK